MVADKVGYLIYWLAEFTGVGAYWADLDFLGVVAHKFPIVAQVFPLVEPIDYNKVWKEASWFGAKGKLLILLVVPFVDLEFFKMLGMSPLKDFERAAEREARLDKAEFDQTAGTPQSAAVSNRRDGSGNGPGAGKALKTAGSALKYIALIAAPLALIFIAFSFVGGSGYGSLVQGAVGNELAGADFDTGFAMVQEGVKTLQCFGNAACLRAWRFNNTQRPGSEEVGQSYSLQVEDFSVNDGNDLDISGRRASYTLPVGFSLYNPRHGLKGIDARGTKYRVRIESLTQREGGAHCGTGWETIGGQYASEIDGVEEGTIVPGGFATPIGSMQELDLSSCGLLQPALGLTRRVALDVKYNYSSQATLYFDAMSRDNLRSLGERPEFKQSQTADTPVKSYVNVESPVTFRQQGGERVSRVFRVRLGMSTDRYDLSYRFDPEEFRLYDSGKTIDVDSAAINNSAATCEGLQPAAEPNAYKLSDSKIESIERRYNNSDWFSRSNQMAPVSCSMVLDKSEISTISPSGETLTMRIDANYTVRLEKSNDDFRTINGRCSDKDFNCPMLVPQHKADQDESLISKCSTSERVDAANGCDVRKGEDWHIVEKINNVDKGIEQGETAYLWSELESELNGPDSWTSNSDYGAIGLPEKVEDVSGPGQVIKLEDSDVDTGEVQAALCGDSGSVREFKDIYRGNNNINQILYFNPVVVNDCEEDTLADNLVETYFWLNPMQSLFVDYDTRKDRYQEALKNCGGVVVVDSSGFRCVT